MLEIRDLQYFPDGRSVVDCVGRRRFKVISRSTRDGYNTAKVEFLKDKIVTDPHELEGSYPYVSYLGIKYLHISRSHIIVLPPTLGHRLGNFETFC